MVGSVCRPGRAGRIERESNDHMNEYMNFNRNQWDALAPIHARSEFYDLAGFRAGQSSLKSVELEEVGDVSGRSLLHMQCHIGLDTLSWARLGARATGIDFSAASLEVARSLAADLGLPARFVEASVYDLPDRLDGPGAFDVVFTSYGVLCWLPDLTAWARVAAHFLRPGGAFHIVEFHPFAGMFDDDEGQTDLRFRYPYFHSDEPMEFEGTGSYADPSADVTTRGFEWCHTLGDVVSALADAGLRIEHLREFPFSAYQQLPMLELCADGWWRMPGGAEGIPLMYSIKAIKR